MHYDLHKMNLVLSILYFCAATLSLATGLITQMFVFILMGLCFSITGVAYLYTFGLERVIGINESIKKKNLEDTQVFKKVK